MHEKFTRPPMSDRVQPTELEEDLKHLTQWSWNEFVPLNSFGAGQQGVVQFMQKGNTKVAVKVVRFRDDQGQDVTEKNKQGLLLELTVLAYVTRFH